jgi:hypothetical protein
LENNAAKASRAPDVLSPRFFNHSRGASKGERAAFDFLLRGFRALRVCRNCSWSGESFLINFAFINLPSNSFVPKNENAMGALRELNNKNSYPPGSDLPENKFSSKTSYA